MSISHSVHRSVKMFSKMRSLKLFVSLIVFIGLFDLFGKCNAELTPPYFNLAEGRKIFASATCGVGIDGPELYCKLVGANTEHEEHFYEVIQGQVCDYCDPTRPDRAHPPEYAIDGTSSWWQSPPLSRGMKYNEVNLTIDFGQEFHVAYIFVRMGNSPRPGLWSLEKSSDYGKTWKPWQHFSDTLTDCETFFGKDSLKPITRDDDVICTTEFSKIVPLEDGEIPIRLLNNRPSANNYFNSTVLQEWTRATNVRFRFYRTKNLLGHLMSMARQDPTVTRRYFYSIKDISIGGRCMCNGHADTCSDYHDPANINRILACDCRHNTAGIHCNECRPGFEQKKWLQNTKAHPFQCEPCNCFGHSNDCKYDEEIDRQGLSLDIHGRYEGGGVCSNCQHNTKGINCNQCEDKFYRPYGRHWNETDVCQHCNCENHFSTGNCDEETGRCQCRKEFLEPNCDQCSYGHFGYPDCRPCICNLNGTDGYYCEPASGKCPCKPNFTGDFCEHCADGFYGPECLPCNCDGIGSANDVCDFKTGQCICNGQFDGKQCDHCKDGYSGYPNCQYCNCDIHGTVPDICDKDTGRCLCKDGYTGTLCANCIAGFYNTFSSPDCLPCNCSIIGSSSTACDALGKCSCLPNFAGRQCTQCSPGYFNYPECLPCNCESPGSNGISCNADGQCTCFNNFDEKTCGQCKEGYYNYPACEECNCDPAGVTARFSGCGSVPVGELCQCKERVSGRICNECKPLYWNLIISNPLGCDECECFTDGTLGALDTCESKTGQCACKPAVSGRSCNECADGSYDLYGGNLFGCKDCNCDIGGSLHSVCDKVTGQCKCHPRVTGQTCSHPITTHYYPTLHQYQFEFEDGYTPNGAQVRYEFEESQFPGFSKRGYAKFTKLQPEVLSEVNIFRSSVYRMVIRYLNPSNDNIVANIVITSDNPSEVDQTAQVLFKPSAEPQFVTVAGAKDELSSAFVLDPGRYTISVKIDRYLLLDYFVLLPAAYYEATILSRKIENPCELGNLELCRHYKYPAITDFKPTYQSFVDGLLGGSSPSVVYSDQEHLELVHESQHLPLCNAAQPTLKYILDVPKTGKYIVVIDYITDRQAPETYIVKVQLKDSIQPAGFATLYSCLYSTVCRQPVIDDESREQIFYIDLQDLKPIEIIGDNETNIAIKSVTAIPVSDWSIDLITPHQVCVIKDGRCVQATYRAAPDSKKISFESGNENQITALNPIDIFDANQKLIYLDENNSVINIRSKVPHPGRYNILVEFYQPNHAEFDIAYKIDADKVSYDGKLNIRNCPSNSGCRELIVNNNAWKSFDIDDNVTITFTNIRRKGVWLSNIYIIPEDQFNENLSTEEHFDQTKEFIEKCGQNHFHIPLNASEFCKKAAFSLTADHNSGALPCNCDYVGSTSFECEPFGGQCQCKPNIIGRRCDACRTGFYGFPDCKPCDCPSKSLCEKDTGACICAPHVVGEKCDRCEPYSFAFDQFFGCELCECNPLGVRNNNLQCDLENGTCDCLQNIEGRRCDRCLNGYFNFPHCQQCRCNIEGTTDEICDQTDESCLCKKNVQGSLCDTCVDGYYNLQASNPEGCNKCFCFGKTTRCEAARLRPYDVNMLKEVSLNSINITKNGPEAQRWDIDGRDLFLNDTALEADFSQRKSPDEWVYFGVLDYLNDQKNHLTAYGGVLTYNLRSTAEIFAKSFNAPDIILEGKDYTLLHRNYEQPASDTIFYGSINMVESSFTTILGLPVTREQFMNVLSSLNAIYIRATYWDRTIITYLYDVNLTMADEDDENPDFYETLSVEKCQCPPGYTGLSCEDCASGYYREGGYCVPCQCNGHSPTCDYYTGKCHTCEHSTTGDHCEQCLIGYHGNATNGSPYDCMICACPIPRDSNNFATSCEISLDGNKIHCKCREGYAGELCQSCSAGYHGRPEEIGDFCKPCECSGNIDVDEVGSCDTVTGECLKCKNNTSGTACNLCAPGFYGDAVQLKNCQSCVCDPIGMEYCDSYVGTCHCLPNVIGPKCDRCENDHYGFDSGHGCLPCDCGIASYSTQCDDHTGECRCKPGVTGRQCDQCLPGYWNLTSEGCLPCSCNNEYSRGVGCNVHTGQCECLPGVVGEKCDACPYRWVLVQDRGCHDCDICHHALLDVTDSLAAELNPVIVDFQSIADGYFTSQKLNHFNSIADEIEPKVKALDPNGINLTPIGLNIDSLESDAKNHERKAHYGNETAVEHVLKGAKLLNDSRNLLTKARLSIDDVQRTIYEVDTLALSFDPSESVKSEQAISEATEILDHLNDIVLEKDPVDARLRSTSDYLNEIERFVAPINTQNKRLAALKSNITEFNNKLDDLHNWSVKANQQSAEAEYQHLRNKNATWNLKLDTVTNQTSEIENNFKNVDVLAKKANVDFGEIYIALQNLENINNELNATNLQVDNGLPKMDEELRSLEPLATRAAEHSALLQESADKVKNELSNIKSNSENPLKAANAHTDIVDSVNAALNKVKSAKEAAGNATELTNGIGNRAGESDQTSRDLLNRAIESLNTVQTDLSPHLISSSGVVQDIKKLNNKSDERNNAINAALDTLPPEIQSGSWKTARDQAIEAQEQAAEAKRILEPILRDLQNGTLSAHQLPKKVDDINSNINQASSQVERIASLLPDLSTRVEDLQRKQENIEALGSDIGDRIDKLKKQIEMARDIANGIKVGVRFHKNTTLELKPPPSLGQLATNTRVSAFVRTEKPNGFLLYLGNENKPDGTRGKQDDFMALEIENGYPFLMVDFGSGPEKIVSNKNIANGEWHQVIVDRNGNDVKLTVREEIENGRDNLHEVETQIAGSQIFDLNNDKTRLFVGGYPPDFNVPNNIRYNTFEGEIEDVRIGDQEVGLWNFVDGQNNVEGAPERNRLIASETPSTGYRFNGQGYVILDAKPYSFKRRSTIHFRFKANRHTTDGLMFYAGKHRHFISVEMQNGAVYFKYKLGQHMVSIGNEHQFNDGEWHQVEAERDGRVGILKIDGSTIHQEETPMGTEENLKISDSLYFGGHPGYINHTEVVQKGFDGCIDNVMISGTQVDLSSNLKSFRVRAGCSNKVSTVLSYPPNQFGYLKLNISANNNLQINLKFRTRQPEGLIFFATDQSRANNIGLWLDDGALVLRSQGVDVSTEPTRYNDSEWHVFTATHDEDKVRLSVDYTPEIISQSNSYPLFLDNADIFFGGLPKGYNIPSSSVTLPSYFVGCISDVVISGQSVNFAESEDRQSAILDNCARDILDYNPADVRIYRPEENIDSSTLEQQLREQKLREQERLREVEEIQRKHQAELDRNNELNQNEREQEKKRLYEEEKQREREREHEQTQIPNRFGVPDGHSPPTIPEYLTTSTTIRPRKHRPSKPQDRICKLPVDPELDSDEDVGYRFGVTGDSRIEFTQIKTNIRKTYEFSLQFKTLESNGVLFYAADARHTDFIALYLQNGYVLHAFSCGSGRTNMTSRNLYNDGKWHTVKITRQQTHGKLIIDGDDESDGEIDGNMRAMNVQSPFYIGGVSPNALQDLNVNLGLQQGTFFTGCIRNILVNDHPINDQPQKYGVLPCSEQVEEGVFFGNGAGHIKLKDRFKVGLELTISMDIKPRTMNGLLLSVHGKKAMLLLQLINGTITFTVNNGEGDIIAIFQPDENQNFCDGEWHTIVAIKSRYVITVTVDGVSSTPSVGSTKSPSADTTRPLFLGGHPYLKKARGLTVRRPYLGCIRNVKIRDKVQNIEPSMTVGNIQCGVCPLN